MPQPRQRAETPSMTATVPRQLVHRAAVAETFLTGWNRTADHRFSVSAQWPRAHGLHVSSDRSAYDPLLVVETVRQSGTLIAHTEYDVPLDHHFVLHEFEVDTFPKHLAVGAVPAELTVEVDFVDVQYRGRRPVGARYTAEVLRGGERVATATRVVFTCIGEPVYRRTAGRPYGRHRGPSAAAARAAAHRRGPGAARGRGSRPGRASWPVAAASRYRTPRFLRPSTRPCPRHAAAGSRPPGGSGAHRRGPFAGVVPDRLRSIRRTGPTCLDRDGGRTRGCRTSRGKAG